MQPVNLPLSITINPWLLDHQVEGTVILPAVEMLQHMACAAKSHFSNARVTTMLHASFYRFIPIEPACTAIDAWCNLEMVDKDTISATITTIAKVKNSNATRIKIHATVHFSAFAPLVTEPPVNPLEAFQVPGFEIPACLLYSELVPFGPAFQTVQGSVILTENAASAYVCAADYPGAAGPLGSPFPLDGSLHAACAWAQRYCGIVAFPVAFKQRLIVRLISPGETIISSVIPVAKREGVIYFDIWLHDLEGSLREMVKEVAMKDISGGRMTSPAWVRSGSSVRLG